MFLATLVVAGSLLPLLLESPPSSALTVAALSYSASFFSGSDLPGASPWPGAEGGLRLAGSGLVSPASACSSSQELVELPLSSSEVRDGLSERDFLYSVTNLSSCSRFLWPS